ncbi:hypothetical protein EON65_54165 [archaeon]|nr:MAG: hypothetical protein EON65_54165 [archaeon]
MTSRIRAAADGDKGKNVSWFAWANGLAQGAVTNSAPWISWVCVEFFSLLLIFQMFICILCW